MTTLHRAARKCGKKVKTSTSKDGKSVIVQAYVEEAGPAEESEE
jgi:hypothetical protein